MNMLVQEFEAKHLKNEEYDFRPGDTVRVSVRIIEAGKERIQDFEGVCMDRRGGGLNESFTVRRISYGVGMERVFPLHAPRIATIRVMRRGKVVESGEAKAVFASPQNDYTRALFAAAFSNEATLERVVSQ